MAGRPGERTDDNRERPGRGTETVGEGVWSGPARITDSRSMMKQLRTEAELASTIMHELRKHPECGDITGVAITRPELQNWGVAWVRDGQKTAPEVAWKIARQFQSEFDLAP